MSEKVYVGKKAASVKKGEAYEPFSRVTMWYDDEGYYTAGDDSGRELTLECPWATQQIVDNVLKQVKGYVYRPFEAAGAVVDPAAELGDGITVGGIYSVIAHTTERFDAMGATDLSAPGEREVDHEYPYESPQERELKRRVKLGQRYFGTRISRKEGLVIEKTDGESVSARAVFNADELSFYDGSNQRVLYFDPGSGTYKFTGMLNVADNFIVDKNGNVTINGSLTMTGSSNWLLTRYSANKNASVPDGWSEAWNGAWDNTSTQVWAIYSYNGGADWTQPMLVQGKDGDRGPSGPSGSDGRDADVPAWVKAYTSSAQFNTLVTDEWVVTMNLLSSKIFGGDYYSKDGAGHFIVSDNGRFANFRLFDSDYMSGGFPVVTFGTAKLGSNSMATIFMYDTEILRTLESNRITKPQGDWDFSDANITGVTAVFG